MGDFLIRSSEIVGKLHALLSASNEEVNLEDVHVSFPYFVSKAKISQKITKSLCTEVEKLKSACFKSMLTKSVLFSFKHSDFNRLEQISV